MAALARIEHELGNDRRDGVAFQAVSQRRPPLPAIVAFEDRVALRPGIDRGRGSMAIEITREWLMPLEMFSQVCPPSRVLKM